MQRRIGLLGVLIMLVLGISNVSAQGIVQGDDVPFLEMLAQVPNTPDVRGAEMYYLDKLAIEAAFPPAQMPPTYADLPRSEDEITDDNIGYDIWWHVYRNVSTGVNDMQMAFGLGEEMPDAMGIDFFDVKREFQFGAPPSNGAILEGPFDLDNVRAAFGGQDFEQVQTDPAELWCWVEGCDQGFMTNIADRNPANVFGGMLGRRQPLVITEGDSLNTLFSSADMNVARQYINVQRGDMNSLADLPQYRAGASALSDQGILIQALVLDGPLWGSFMSGPAMVLSITPNMTAEQRAELMERFITEQLDGFVELPQFELIMFGDVVREDTQDAVIALVYSDEADAQAATEVIPARLETVDSMARQRPWGDMLRDFLVFDINTAVIEAEDKYVALISLPTALVPGDQVIAETEINLSNEAGSPDLVPPGIVYRLLVSAFMQRDLTWLDTTTRFELESMLAD